MSIAPTALIQITNTTATQTSTFSNVPLAAAMATLTIAPVSLRIVRPSLHSTQCPNLCKMPRVASASFALSLELCA